MSKGILVMSDSAKLTMASETDLEPGQVESVIDQTTLLSACHTLALLLILS
jgi:hypothetical protein